MALNVVVLMGRLARDVEIRENGDMKIATFTVAVNRDRSKENDAADFIRCVTFRQSAEFVSKYFSKGDMIAVEGRLSVRQYKDKDGNNRSMTEVIANRISFCGSRREAGKADNPPQMYATDVNDVADVPEAADDLPF